MLTLRLQSTCMIQLSSADRLRPKQSLVKERKKETKKDRQTDRKKERKKERVRAL